MGLRDIWKADQRRWASDHSCSHDASGYVDSLSLNLFRPMSSATEAEFSRGSGGELRARNGSIRPKMHALHSSSVLVCNVFDYWRSMAPGLLGEALGVEPRIERLTFEAQFPTGLPGEPPNIDVALWLENGDVWGIESKFTEPFGGQKHRPAFKEKYFPAGRPVWSDRGLARSSALAVALQNGAVAFRHLDAAQLLKHALGLRVNHQDRFTLCYLYADQDTAEGRQHRNEINKFALAVDGDFDFVPVSYATLLKQLRNLTSGEHDAYFAYIDGRYGFARATPVSVGGCSDTSPLGGRERGGV